MGEVYAGALPAVHEHIVSTALQVVSDGSKALTESLLTDYVDTMSDVL